MRDAPATIPHPAADFSGTGFVATETRSPVIGLNGSRVSLLSLAAEQGVRAVLVTDGVCALTPAFAEVWREAGAAWVVRSDVGLREGFSGRKLTDIAEVFTVPPVRSIDDLDLGFLHPTPATAVQVTALVSLRHRAQPSTVLGGPAARLAELMTGQPPTVWGAHEPAGNRWNRSELTAFVREQMPGPVLVLGSGPRFTAIITVQRTDKGLEEITQVTASLGSPGPEGFERVRQQLLGYLGELTAAAMPLVGLILARPGQDDLLVRPTLALPPTPIALLIGPPGVRGLKIDVSAMVEQFGALTVGRPQIPGLLFSLGGLADDTWTRLDDILAAIGRDELTEVLGLSPRLTTGPADLAPEDLATGDVAMGDVAMGDPGVDHAE